MSSLDHHGPAEVAQAHAFYTTFGPISRLSSIVVILIFCIILTYLRVFSCYFSSIVRAIRHETWFLGGVHTHELMHDVESINGRQP